MITHCVPDGVGAQVADIDRLLGQEVVRAGVVPDDVHLRGWGTKNPVSLLLLVYTASGSVSAAPSHPSKQQPAQGRTPGEPTYTDNHTNIPSM